MFSNKLASIFVIVLLSSCAATKPTSPLAELIETGGAVKITNVEYTELLAGNTIRGKNGSSTLYRKDGVKLIREKDGTLTERNWYKDDDGALCHTLWKDSKLSCINEVADFHVARSGSTLFTAGKESVSEWELVEGNPDNL